MGRAESRPRERQSRRLSFGLRRAAGASSLPFLSRLPRAAALLALALPLLAAAVLVPAGEARAQTTVTLVSNTGQSITAGNLILHSLGQRFRTGGNAIGYNLASVGVALRSLGTDPTVANTATVTLRKSTSGGRPGDVVYTFTSPTLAANSVNTFTAPDDAVLSANTNYIVVIEGTGGRVTVGRTGTAEDAGAATGFSIANERLTCTSPCTSWDTDSSAIFGIRVSGSARAPLPVVQFVSSAISLDEPDSEYRQSFSTVRITGTRQGDVSVNYTISPSGSNAATPCPTGTTLSSCNNAGYDFFVTDNNFSVSEYSGTLTFGVINTTRNIGVLLVPDTVDEPNETFTITLSDPTNATLGTKSVQTVTIVDNDEPAVPAAPTNLRTTAVRAFEVELAWDAVAGADSYQYRVQGDSGTWSAWTDQPDGGSDASVFVRGLAPSSAYGFQVRAVNSTGTGAASAELSATTGSLSWTVATDETGYTEGEDIAVTVRAVVTDYVTVTECPSSLPLYLVLEVSDPDGVLSNAATRSLTFGGCQPSKTVTFASVDDSVDEANAAVTFTLAVAQANTTPHLADTLGATPPSAQVTVADNDEPGGNANNPPTGVPTITGTPQVGGTLTANTSGIADADGLGTFAYQWIRGAATDIAGATGSTYGPVAADVGETLKVRVSWTDGGGTAESLISAPTAAVTDGTVTTPVAPGSRTVRAVLYPRSEWSASGSEGQYLLVDWREVGDRSCAAGYDVQFDSTTASDFPPRWRGQGDPITDERGAGQRNWRPLNTYRHHGIWNLGIAQEQVRVVCTGDGRIVGETVAHRGTALPPWGEGGEQQAVLPAVRLSAGSESAAEGDALEFTLTRTGAAEADLAVSLDVSESGAMLAALPARVPIPAGEASVTFTVATLDDDTEEAASVVTVAIAGDAERYVLGEPSTAAVTVEDDDGEAAALTAAFEAAPERHDGTSRFAFELHLSEEPVGFSYRTLRDRSFAVTGGRVRIARRLERPSNMHWQITVAPSTDGDVTVSLPATTDCAAAAAICTADGRKLSGEATLVVPGPSSNTAPTGLPAIAGTARVGETLEASVTGIADEDGLSGATYSYRWVSSDGTADADIAGATAASYTLTAAEAGRTVKVRVTFADDGGTEETLVSAATGAVEPVAPAAASNAAPTGLPTIAGTARVGETLAASVTEIADEDGLGGAAYSYRWVSSDGGGTDTDIAGATTAEYTLTAAEAGKAVKVRVTFTDDAGTEETLVSAATDAVAAANAAPTGLPTISGTARVGETLAASVTEIADADGLGNGAFAYRWVSNDGETDANIAGAVEASYTLTAAEAGKAVKVRVTFTDDAGTEETLVSAATDAVAAANAAPTGLPAIAGTARVGETLEASVTEIADADGLDSAAFAYRWVSNDGETDADIADATAASYTLTAAEAGRTVKVWVTFTDDAGTEETLLSAATAAVSAALPEVSIAAADSPVTEGAAARFTLRRTGGTAAALEVAVSVSAAGAVLDGAAPSTVRFAAGAAEAVLAVATADDAAAEPDGRVTAAVAAGDGYRAVAGAAGVDVFDNDRATAPAPAETVLWSADMEVIDFGGGSSGADSPDLFTNAGGSGGLRVQWLWHYGPERRLYFGLKTPVRDTGGLSLRLGGMTLPFADANGSDSSFNWAGVDVDWADGETVAVRLVRTAEAAAPGPGPGVSVADARVREAAGAVLRFTVTLAAAPSETVSVRYASSDGTATAGADYVAASGAVRFGPGQRSRTVSVRVLDDAHDEGAETMTLRLSAPFGAEISDGTATGTIDNTDAMPAAWLARFGRTVTGHVLDAVEARLKAPRTPGMEASLAGQALPSWTPGSKSGAGPGSALGAGPGSGSGAGGGAVSRFGAAADAEERGAMTALGAWLAQAGPVGQDTSRNGASRNGGSATGREAESRALTGRDFIAGTSFALTAGSAGDGGSVSVWGRGAISGFDGREGGLSLDGEVTTGLIGADWASAPGSGAGRWTAGLAVGHSRGTGGYRSGAGAGEIAGGIDATLTGVYPYAGMTLTDRLSVWTAAGYGSGEVTVTPAGQEALTADLTMRMGAAGIRSELLTPAEDGGLSLAVKGDGRFTRTSSGSASGTSGGRLEASDADVWLLRTGVEGSRTFGLGDGDGATLTPSFELGLRLDGGDAETGFGADMGGGLAFADPKHGLSLEFRARGLLAHESSGFREWGASAGLAWDPRPSTDRGLSLSLRQGWGVSPTGGMDSLLGRETLAGLAANDNAGPGAGAGGNGFKASSRLEAGIGYGIALFGGGFTGTPNVGFGLSETGRDYRLGWRLTSAVPGDPGFEVNLDATRRESANDDTPEHAVALRATVRW